MFGQADAGVRGRPRPEPFVDFLQEMQGRTGETAWDRLG